MSRLLSWGLLAYVLALFAPSLLAADPIVGGVVLLLILGWLMPPD